MISIKIGWELDWNGCWICTTHKPNKKGGYPRKKVNGKNTPISHIMYEMVHGENSINGLKVLHSCDNPQCINPEHLSLGTQKENARQMMERGRWGGMRGSDVHTAKLTVEIVKLIRNDKTSSNVELAKKYNVNRSTIRRVRLNKTWKEVE